ncbi:MAG: VWA domain-containing protein [Planctomycetales bacterium]
MPQKKRHGGIIHSYQKYDPVKFPSPTEAPPDLASAAMEHMMLYGSMRELSEEELARAVRLDPSQIAGLGPSLDALIALLMERKRKILEKYETEQVQDEARKIYRNRSRQVDPPEELQGFFDEAVRYEQLRDLERLWYQAGDDSGPLALSLVKLIAVLSDKYQVDELAAKYDFVGRTPMTIPQALEIKEELEKIDELLQQLREARQSAQIAVIDMEALAEFTEPGDIDQLSALQQQIQDMVRELAERQGLEFTAGQFRLSPKAFRLFQGRLLSRIFSQLAPSRTGRHSGPVVGEGAVETQQTKEYEFGDSLTHMDLAQSFTNAVVRDGPGLPVRLTSDDLVIHRTRNTPKCATVVLMDMSGSMRYDGQYVNVKRMALALEGLIRGEYPGDYLQFVELYTFAKPRSASELAELMPKPVTIFDPIVRLRADMSREDLSELQLPPHFTNIQHGLKLSRQFLATQDTPNRQIILITDGLPTAHFEAQMLYLLYPPDPRTEAATMREAYLCHREAITINIFLLPSWSQSHEDVQFAHRLAESTQGRVFFNPGNDLDRYVVWDYLTQSREIIALIPVR